MIAIESIDEKRKFLTNAIDISFGGIKGLGLLVTPEFQDFTDEKLRQLDLIIAEAKTAIETGNFELIDVLISETLKEAAKK